MYLSACTVAANKLKISVVYNTFISYSWVCGLGNTLLGSAGLCWAWSLIVVWVQIYSNCPHFGTGLKEQPFSGACYSGDRAQKLKRMSRNMEFLLNPSLGPGTMPLLPTFFLFHAKLVFIFSFTYGAPKMLGIYIVCQWQDSNGGSSR